jgi:hypothetical protein
MSVRVLKKVKKYWPDVDPQEIIDVIKEGGSERVQLAIIKLSKGEREQLPGLVKMAKADWRDVLAYAEYPEAMKTGPIAMMKMSPDEAKAIRQRDKRQYQKWLKG